MKKFLLFTLTALLALGVTACGGTASEPASEPERPTGPVGGGDTVQIANPFATCDTLEEVEAITGFPITLPEEGPAWEHEIIYRATVVGDMLEIIYAGEGDEIRIRKTPDSRENISGVYDEFTASEEVTVGEHTVTMQGDGERVSIALWSDGGYNYFIRAEQSLTQEEMSQWVQAIA